MTTLSAFIYKRKHYKVSYEQIEKELRKQIEENIKPNLLEGESFDTTPIEGSVGDGYFSISVSTERAEFWREILDRAWDVFAPHKLPEGVWWGELEIDEGAFKGRLTYTGSGWDHRWCAVVNKKDPNYKGGFDRTYLKKYFEKGYSYYLPEDGLKVGQILNWGAKSKRSIDNDFSVVTEVTDDRATFVVFPNYTPAKKYAAKLPVSKVEDDIKNVFEITEVRK